MRATSWVGARRVVTAAACLVLVVVGFAAVRDVPHDSRVFAHDRKAVYAPMSQLERSTYVLRRNELPDAFERFRRVLRPGDRFALVIPPTTQRDTAGMYRLFALYYLLPALAAPDASRADAVLVFGDVPERIRRRFWQLEQLPGPIWLGRRR